MYVLRIALETAARALWLAADRLRPVEPPPEGTYTVLFVQGGWVETEFGGVPRREPRVAYVLGEATDFHSGLAAMDRVGPGAMQAHDWKGEVVLMDPEDRRVASWMGSRRRAPAPAG